MTRIFEQPQKLILDNGIGFITKEEISLALDRFCAEIKYPITLIYLDNDDNLKRIDSTRVGFLLDKACDVFRKMGGFYNCVENDNIHARPYLTGEKTPPICGYEVYKCKYMGYQEYMFTIEIEKKVIAILFVGQIQILGDIEVIKTKQDCIANFQNKFKESLSKLSGTHAISLKDVKEQILSDNIDPFLLINVDKDFDVNKTRRYFTSQDEVDRFIVREVMPQVNGFIQDIKKALFDYRKKHTTQIIEDFETNYNDKHILYLKKYDSLEEHRRESINEYWKEFRDLFLKLKDNLCLKELKYFEQKLSNKKSSSSNLFELKISTETDNQEEYCFDDCTSQDLCFIVDERANVKYVLKFDFDDNDCVDLELKNHIKNELAKSMRNTLDICSYAIRSKVDSDANLTTLRIYRHEMDQLILTLASINYKLSPQYKEGLDSAKIEKMHKDFTSSLDLANYLSQNMGYFTNTQRGVPFSFEPKTIVNMFGDGLLNKWRLFVMDETIKKHSEILIPTEDERRKRDGYFGSVFCISKGLELILYNIIHNAVKYCHRGTNIYLDCNYIVNAKNEKRHKITVTDYGTGIFAKRHEDIFKLYYRDPETSMNAEGSGIGLYISKLIADSIGVDLDYNCELISEYNVPLIDRFIQEYDNSVSVSVDNLKKESKRISEDNSVQIISNYANRIVSRGVKNGICDQTYKVTFEVII